MNFLTIAQCMAAAAFLAMAIVHLLVWSRVRSEINHLLFATTLAAAAANAFAEANMYRSDSIGTMAVALRWYVDDFRIMGDRPQYGSSPPTRG